MNAFTPELARVSPFLTTSDSTPDVNANNI